MAVPAKPSLDYSYTGFQQAQGNNQFPGTQLDNDLANLATSIDETIDFLGSVIREDGKLQNAIVTKDTLASDLLLGIAPPSQWATATQYTADDTVFEDNTLYIAVETHVSGTFATDLDDGKWSAIAVFTPLSSISDGSVTEPKHATGGVSTRALANGAVTTDKHGDASVTLAKLAADVTAALVPIGAMVPYAGPIAPAKWYFAFGQALSRSTYSALMGALTAAAVGSVSSGSQSITGVTADLRGLGLEGAVIEGAGIPGGATVSAVSATTITLSTNATATNGSAALRIFPHGNGDGSTTFNLPDRCGRGSVGRDNMGGTASNRLTSAGSGVDGAKLGSVGGAQTVTLAETQIPSHTHTAVVTDPGHQHASGSLATNLGTQYQLGTTATPAGTTSGAVNAATTGISVTNQATGGGQAHNNVPPVGVDNIIIYAGV